MYTLKIGVSDHIKFLNHSARWTLLNTQLMDDARETPIKLKGNSFKILPHANFMV